MPLAGTPRHFRTPAAFRAWLEKHHATHADLWVGFYKRHSAKQGITYQEALDEALCFGWIDGIVKSVDADSYMHRFTPRKATSHWSNVNVRRFAELDADGQVASAGRAAFERRTAERTGKASFELPPAEFTAAQERALKANKTASTFYDKQPPSYKKVVKHWVTRAKQEATKERRLSVLIDCCERGERIPQFISPVGKR